MTTINEPLKMNISKEREIIRQQLWVSIYEKSFQVEKPRDAYFHANKAVEEFDKTFSNNFASSKETSELDKAIEIHKF